MEQEQAKRQYWIEVQRLNDLQEALRLAAGNVARLQTQVAAQALIVRELDARGWTVAA